MTQLLRTSLVLIVIAVGGHAAAQQALVTENKFTALYLQELRRQAPDLEVRISGPMELAIVTDDGDINAYLGNAFARYRSDPDRLSDVIQDYVAATVETVRDRHSDLDVTRIVPVIKGADYLTELQRHAKELASTPGNWMPWNYRQTLDAISALAATAS